MSFEWPISDWQPVREQSPIEFDNKFPASKNFNFLHKCCRLNSRFQFGWNRVSFIICDLCYLVPMVMFSNALGSCNIEHLQYDRVLACDEEVRECLWNIFLWEFSQNPSLLSLSLSLSHHCPLRWQKVNESLSCLHSGNWMEEESPEHSCLGRPQLTICSSACCYQNTKIPY